MSKRILMTMVFGLGLALLGTARAAAQEKTKPEEKKPVSAKEVFHVYGGSCSRSTRLLSSHDNLNAAVQAAAEARKNKNIRVVVTTGTAGSYFLGMKADEYQVCARGLRCGNWFMREKAATLENAVEITKSLEKNGARETEIVHHFIAKK
jgi:heme/copper-type cytochrome/quinol oxidase subunit 3